jgi:hypothetical protein
MIFDGRQNTTLGALVLLQCGDIGGSVSKSSRAQVGVSPEAIRRNLTEEDF